VASTKQARKQARLGGVLSLPSNNPSVDLQSCLRNGIALRRLARHDAPVQLRVLQVPAIWSNGPAALWVEGSCHSNHVVTFRKAGIRGKSAQAAATSHAASLPTARLQALRV